MLTSIKFALILFGPVAASLSASAATALHHYDFDGGGIFDSVGFAHGALAGGATVSAGTLNLNGTTAYAQFGVKLVPTNNFSVALFAQELTPTSDRAELISQGWTYEPGFYLGYYGATRNIRVGDQWQGTGRKFPLDGQMHHYAATTDPLGARLYMDGVCVASNAPIQVATGGIDTRLGQQFDPWGEFFHGSIDEVWVFDGALTPAEVAQLAAVKPLPPKVTIDVAQVRLCWPTQPNVRYQVQYRSALTTNKWADSGAVLLGDGTTNCIRDDVSGVMRQYRVIAFP